MTLLVTALFAAPSPYQTHNSYLGETIDTQYGGLVLSNTDVSLPGRNGMDIKITRTYNSRQGGKINYSQAGSVEEQSLRPRTYALDKYNPENWQPLSVGQYSLLGANGWQIGIGGIAVKNSYYYDFRKNQKNQDDIEYNSWYVQFGDGNTIYFNQDGTPKDSRNKGRIDVLRNESGFIYTDVAGNKYYFSLKTAGKGFSKIWIQREDPASNPFHDKKRTYVGDAEAESSVFLLKRVENKFGDWVEYIYDNENKPWSTIGRDVNITDADFWERVHSGPGNSRYYDLTAKKKFNYYWGYGAYRLVQVKNSLKNNMDISYNKFGRISGLAFTYSNGSAATVKYDYNGCLLSAFTNIRGEVTKYDYNNSNLISSVLTPLQGKSNYEYLPSKTGDKELDGYVVKTKTLDDGKNKYTYKYDYKYGHIFDRGYGKEFCFGETSITDPRNIKTTHYYKNGNPIREFSPNQVITEYTWDSKGNKTSEIVIKGAKRYITKYEYDDYGNATLITNEGDPDTTADDKIMHNEYLINTVQKAGANYPEITPGDARYNCLFAQAVHSWVTDGRGGNISNQVYFRYDTNGLLLQKEVVVEGKNTYITKYTYDKYGQLAVKYLPNNFGKISYTYDYGSQTYSVTETTIDSLQFTKKEYDKYSGLIKSETDNLGHSISYSYDSYGFLESKRDNLTGLSDTYTYTAPGGSSGAIYTHTDALGNITKTTLDSVGRVYSEEVRPIGLSTRITKHEYSNEIPNAEAKVIDYQGRETTYKYDSMNRPVIQVNYDGTYTVTRYYDLENKKEVYDVKGQKITYVYDAFGNIIKTIQPNGAVASYEYNIQGKLAKLITPLSRDNTSIVSYDYDSIGRLTKITKGSVSTEMEYDALDRVAHKRVPDKIIGEKVQYVDVYYDFNVITQLLSSIRTIGGNYPNVVLFDYYSDRGGFGRLKTVKDSSGSTTYGYDKYGSVVSVDRNQFGQKRSTYYTYNEYGELLKVQYPGQTEAIVYNYDSAHRVKNIEYQRSFLSKDVLAQYQYSAGLNSRLDKIAYKNGVETEYAYDSHDRVNKISTARGSNIIFSHEYNYDDLGNRSDFTWEIDKSGKNKVEYTYDTQYQLTGVKYGEGRSFVYKYDDNGNRKYFGHDFGYETLTYDQYDRLNTRDMRDSQIKYKYDLRGNLIQKSKTAGTTELSYSDYSFDSNDRLIAIYENGQKRAENAYDDRGMRVMSSVTPLGYATVDAVPGTPETNYYWYGAGTEVLADTDASGNVTTMYITAGRQKLAAIKPATATTPEIMSFYHTDVLGSVVAITDGVGQIVEANIYGPFGETEFSYKGAFYKAYGHDNRYGYTGQEQDTPGGLMYYNARWYDTETGRFISEDPALATPTDPLSLNRYIYCRNNPLIYTDPTGMLFSEWLSYFGPIGTAIGTLIDGYLVTQAVGFAVTQISGIMEKNGDYENAQFLRDAYSVYSTIQMVQSAIDAFGSLTKTADGAPAGGTGVVKERLLESDLNTDGLIIEIDVDGSSAPRDPSAGGYGAARTGGYHAGNDQNMAAGTRVGDIRTNATIMGSRPLVDKLHPDNPFQGYQYELKVNGKSYTLNLIHMDPVTRQTFDLTSGKFNDWGLNATNTTNHLHAQLMRSDMSFINTKNIIKYNDVSIGGKYGSLF